MRFLLDFQDRQLAPAITVHRGFEESPELAGHDGPEP
jgi:hypothetical protein